MIVVYPLVEVYGINFDGTGNVKIQILSDEDGEVDEGTKHTWYKAASVFCFPSFMEGFGFPVAEAMSHGTPVVTSSTTATAEVAGDSALLIDPKSADAIAEAITEILHKSELSEELSEKGLERAKKMTWEDTALATADIYREVVY